MELNNIPKTGNYGSGVDLHNDNYQKIGLKLETLEERSFNEKGYFENLSSLQSKYPTPQTGWQAYVKDAGSSTGYYVANVNSSGNWVVTAAEAPPINVDLAGYAKTGGSDKTVKEVEDEIVQLASEKIAVSEIGTLNLNSILPLSSEIYENGYWSSSMEPVAGNSFVRTKEFRPIKPSTRYILGGSSTYTGAITVRLCDADGNFVQTVTKTSGNTGAPKFTTPENVTQYKLYLSNNPLGPITTKFPRTVALYLEEDLLYTKAASGGSETTMAQVDQSLNNIAEEIEEIRGDVKIVSHALSQNQMNCAICADDSGNIYYAVADTRLFLYNKAGYMGMVGFPDEVNRAGNQLEIAIAVEGSTMHVVSTGYRLTDADNGLYYCTIDLTTLAITYKGKITNGFNSVMRCTNMVKFSDALYIASITMGEIVGGVADTTLGSRKVELFKLEAGSWVFQSLIAEKDELWGYAFENNYGTEFATFNPPVSLFPRSLYTDGNNLYCALINGASNDYQHCIFVKYFDGTNWVKDSIVANTRAVNVKGYFNQLGEQRFLAARYKNGYYNQSRHTCVTNGPGDKLFNIDGLKDAPFFDFGMVKVGGEVHIIYSQPRATGVNTPFYYVQVKELSIEGGINVSAKNYKGELFTDTVPDTSKLQVGDYFIIKEPGIYLNLLKTEFPLKTTFKKYYINNNRGQQKKAIWGGYYWQDEIMFDRNISPDKHTALEGRPQRNVFKAFGFRIPSITQTIDGYLIGCADVKHAHGKDDDEADICVYRSRGGEVWRDINIVFEHGGEGWRAINPALVVDTHSDSNERGRIWAFCSDWRSNQGIGQWWADNPEYLVLTYCYSDDNGLTWEGYTDYVSPDSAIWRIIPGCASGITMEDGTLIMPVYVRETGVDGSHAAFVYKELNSSVWQMGDIVPDAAGGLKSNENQILQDTDGSLLMNARTDSAYKRLFFRLQSISGGWTEVPEMEVFTGIGGTAGSFVRYKNTYLYSHPRYGSRKGITVYYSYDKINVNILAEITPYEQDTDGGILGYSSIVCTDDHFGIIYEDENYTIAYKDLNCYRYLLR